VVTRAGWKLLDDRLKLQGVDLAVAAHRQALVKSLRLPEGVLSDIACGLSPAISEYFLKPLAEFAKVPLHAITETRAQELITFAGLDGGGDLRIWVPAAVLAAEMAGVVMAGGIHIRVGVGPGQVRASCDYGAELLCKRIVSGQVEAGGRYLIRHHGQHVVGLAFGSDAFALDDHGRQGGESNYQAIVGVREVEVVAQVVAELSVGRAWRPEEFASECAEVVVPESGWALLCEYLRAEGLDPALPAGRHKLSQEFGVAASTFYQLWESKGSSAPRSLLAELCERASIDISVVLNQDECEYLPFRDVMGPEAFGLIVPADWSDLPVALRQDCVFVRNSELVHPLPGTLMLATTALSITAGASYLIDQRGSGLLVARALQPEGSSGGLWRFAREGEGSEFTMPVGSAGQRADRLLIYSPEAPHALVGRLIGELRVQA
jgi:hypothetical protein